MEELHVLFANLVCDADFADQRSFVVGVGHLDLTDSTKRNGDVGETVFGGTAVYDISGDVFSRLEDVI